MKSDKLLFYLIIIICVLLFIYIVYNLILNTCNCVKEGFVSSEKFYEKIRETSQKDTNCETSGNSDSLFVKDFTGGGYFKYKKLDGTSCTKDDYDIDPKKCIREMDSTRTMSGDSITPDFYFNSSEFKSIIDNKGPSNKNTEAHTYDRFIKNVLKENVSKLAINSSSFYNINLTIDFEIKRNNDDDFKKYSDLYSEIKNERIIDINPIYGRKEVTLDNSYNFLLDNTTTEVQKENLINKININGKYNLIDCKLWQKEITNNIPGENKFYLKYDNTDEETKILYLCHSNNNSTNDLTYLFIVNYDSQFVNKLTTDIRDINLKNPMFTDSCHILLKDVSNYNEKNKKCSNEYVILKNNFTSWADEIFEPVTWENNKKKECNESCFIDRKHLYYFENLDDNEKYFISSKAWKNKVNMERDSALNPNRSWKCKEQCPEGLVSFNDISGAYDAVPEDIFGSTAEEGRVNNIFWSNQFGCPINKDGQPEKSEKYKVPTDLIDAYKSYTGFNDGEQQINSDGKFDTLEKCQQGSKNFAKSIYENSKMDDKNIIVDFFLNRQAGMLEDNYISPKCPDTCSKTVTVMHQGLPYKIKQDGGCNDLNDPGCNYDIRKQNFNVNDYDSNAKPYSCSECPPERDDSFNGYIIRSKDREVMDGYDTTTKDDINDTLENPEERCKENEEWLKRLKESVVKELYFDNNENAQKIGQEYLSKICSCLGYKSTCTLSLPDAEKIGKNFIGWAKGEITQVGLSEATSDIIKLNKFDLFNEMFGESDVEEYSALLDLNLTGNHY